MKIEAIRLAAFKRFTRPVAVEGLAAGINVLAGPNEMGKSTVFAALEAAFKTRHKVTGSVLEGMRPLSGGEPLVEVDFTVGARSLRLRKQFGRASTTILSDAKSGRILLRNAEAEEELARLIARHDGIEGRFGLVWVRQQRALRRPDPDYDPKAGRAKAGPEVGTLNAAVRGEIEAAAAGEALQRIQALTTKALDQLLTTRKARKDGPLDRALRARNEAQTGLDRAERAAASAERRLEEIESLAAELAELKAPAVASHRAEEIARIEARLRDEQNGRTERELLHEALRTRRLEREGAARRLRDSEERATRLAKLTQQAEVAHSLQREIALTAEDLNSDPATPQTLDRLATLVRTRDLAHAELGRDPVVVDVAIEPGGEGKIAFDGKPLTASARHKIAEKVEIAVPGIAKISVEPPAAARAAAARKRVGETTAEIDRICAALAVATVEEASARAASRSAKAKALDVSRARLSGLAPAGIADLEREIEALRALDAAEGDAGTLHEALKSAEAVEHVARARYDALNAALLSENAFKDLNAGWKSAVAAAEAAARQIQRCENRIENLKSEQAGADEDGFAGQVDGFRDLFERHDRETKRLEAEGEALKLLSLTLAEVEAGARDKVFAPITRRLKPYLSDVFGAADLGFKDSFAVSSFTRDGEKHDFETLSDGTQEQLSVLVRVAYAELLSEQSEGVPLVLDDPLVYSDDARLESLCRVLERAAQKMQIVLLTCRPLAFQKLSGHRVNLSTWQPEETSAIG